MMSFLRIKRTALHKEEIIPAYFGRSPILDTQILNLWSVYLQNRVVKGAMQVNIPSFECLGYDSFKINQMYPNVGEKKET